MVRKKYITFVKIIFLNFITVYSSLAVENTSSSYDSMVRGAIKLGENSDDPELKRKSLEIKESYEEEKRLEKELAEAREESATWKEMKVEFDKSPNQDLSQALLERSIKELKLSSDAIWMMMERKDPKIMAIYDKMGKEEVQKMYKKVKARRAAKNLNKINNK